MCLVYMTFCLCFQLFLCFDNNQIVFFNFITNYFRMRFKGAYIMFVIYGLSKQHTGLVCLTNNNEDNRSQTARSNAFFTVFVE